MPKIIDRTGETANASNGMTMTITKYRNAKDIDVRFEDGTERKHVSYEKFKTGHIAYEQKEKQNLIGRKVTNADGLVMECIAYESRRVNVRFEDGSIRNNVEYNNFLNGRVPHPSKARPRKSHINEHTVNKQGLRMTLIRWHGRDDVDIQFEDGTIREHIQYQYFKRQALSHPKLKIKRNIVKGSLYNTQISGIAHNGNHTTHYICYCPICNEKFIATFEQIKNHKCNIDHPDQKLLKNLISA